MPLTYEELYALSYDPTFAGRIKMAKILTASWVWDEPIGDLNEPRRAWSKKCFTNSEQGAFQGVVNMVIADGTTVLYGDAMTDAELQSILDNNVPYMIEIE
jgi:hypothetical protein